MKTHLEPVWNAMAPLGRQIKLLFAEHNFITVVCGFLVVLMVLSFYRFLRSISPALVGFVLLLVLALLILHWVETRSEPPFLKPFMDWLAPFFPAPGAAGKHW
jgi:cell division protein FtsW (lipid II flippase)